MSRQNRLPQGITRTNDTQLRQWRHRLFGCRRRPAFARNCLDMVQRQQPFDAPRPFHGKTPPPRRQNMILDHLVQRRFRRERLAFGRHDFANCVPGQQALQRHLLHTGGRGVLQEPTNKRDYEKVDAAAVTPMRQPSAGCANRVGDASCDPALAGDERVSAVRAQNAMDLFPSLRKSGRGNVLPSDRSELRYRPRSRGLRQQCSTAPD